MAPAALLHPAWNDPQGTGHTAQTQAQGKGAVQVQSGGQVCGGPEHNPLSGLQVPSWQVSAGTQSRSTAQEAPRSRQWPGASVATSDQP